MNGNVHTEDFKKNRGLYRSLTESVCVARRTEIKNPRQSEARNQFLQYHAAGRMKAASDPLLQQMGCATHRCFSSRKSWPMSVSI
jgi:hypothetical protein